MPGSEERQEADVQIAGCFCPSCSRVLLSILDWWAYFIIFIFVHSYHNLKVWFRFRKEEVSVTLKPLEVSVIPCSTCSATQQWILDHLILAMSGSLPPVPFENLHLAGLKPPAMVLPENGCQNIDGLMACRCLPCLSLSKLLFDGHSPCHQVLFPGPERKAARRQADLSPCHVTPTVRRTPVMNR